MENLRKCRRSADTDARASAGHWRGFKSSDSIALSFWSTSFARNGSGSAYCQCQNHWRANSRKPTPPPSGLPHLLCDSLLPPLLTFSPTFRGQDTAPVPRLDAQALTQLSSRRLWFAKGIMPSPTFSFDQTGWPTGNETGYHEGASAHIQVGDRDEGRGTGARAFGAAHVGGGVCTSRLAVRDPAASAAAPRGTGWHLGMGGGRAEPYMKRSFSVRYERFSTVTRRASSCSLGMDASRGGGGPPHLCGFQHSRILALVYCIYRLISCGSALAARPASGLFHTRTREVFVVSQ